MFKLRLCALATLLFISSCATERPALKGTDGASIPAAFAHFPDVPFPESSYINLKETKALGSGDNWIGSLAFNSPYNASSVFDFYMSEMPKLSWTEIATVRANISQMTYTRDNRVVQILIESNGSDKAAITVTAIPNQSSSK